MLVEILGVHLQKVLIVILDHPARAQSLVKKHFLDANDCQSDQAERVQCDKSDIDTLYKMMNVEGVNKIWQ